jgi:hypothetical protein
MRAASPPAQGQSDVEAGTPATPTAQQRIAQLEEELGIFEETRRAAEAAQFETFERFEQD